MGGEREGEREREKEGRGSPYLLKGIKALTKNYIR